MEDSFKKEGVEKKNYELAFLVKEEAAIDDLKRIVRQSEVEIQLESPLKKVNLAYKIKNIGEAYFGFLRLVSEPASMHSLARDLRTNPAIVRFLVVSLPKEEMAGIQSPMRRERPIARRMPIPKEVVRQQAKPLSNEALERKIEEILQ